MDSSEGGSGAIEHGFAEFVSSTMAPIVKELVLFYILYNSLYYLFFFLSYFKFLIYVCAKIEKVEYGPLDLSHTSISVSFFLFVYLLTFCNQVRVEMIKAFETYFPPHLLESLRLVFIFQWI